MTIPLPQPIQPVQPTEPPIRITNTPENPRRLINNFVLSEDNSNAYRKFKVGNPERELTITVFFPENCDRNEKIRRLHLFNEQNVRLLGEEAIKLGLGKNSKKGKGVLNAIHFKRNTENELVSAEKHFTRNQQPKLIDEKYYRDKIAHANTPPEKKVKFQKKLDVFKNTQAVWHAIKTPQATPSTEHVPPIPVQQPPRPLNSSTPLLADDEQFKNRMRQEVHGTPPSSVDLP